MRFIQVPHHGSIKNWNNNILSEFPKANMFFASARKVNKRLKHPHVRVKSYIEEHGNYFRHVTEDEPCCYYDESIFISIKKEYNL